MIMGAYNSTNLIFLLDIPRDTARGLRCDSQKLRSGNATKAPKNWGASPIMTIEFPIDGVKVSSPATAADKKHRITPHKPKTHK
jgi:hypothetical protein